MKHVFALRVLMHAMADNVYHMPGVLPDVPVNAWSRLARSLLFVNQTCFLVTVPGSVNADVSHLRGKYCRHDPARTPRLT